MSLKVWSILGPPKKNSKSPEVGRFSENHAESKFSNFATEIGLFWLIFSDLRIYFFYVGIILWGFFIS